MAIAEIDDRRVIAKALANTYTGERTGWERVQEYHRVMGYVADHPSQKSAAIASALDLPRSRIRAWVDGDGKPDPVHALEAAEANRWLDLTWHDPPFTTFNRLTAWVFAGGSINTQFVPSFSATDQPEQRRIEDHFDTLELDYRIVNDDTTARATEYVPKDHSPLLGRLLVVLGAPQGTKNKAVEITLPEYLWNAPESVQLGFAQTYVFLRGAKQPERPNWPIAISEQRSPEFKQELRELLVDLVGADGVSGSTTASSLYLAPDTAERLLP